MPSYRLEKGSVQAGFYYSRNKVQIFGGAFANGKTTALAVKGLHLARDYPGSNGLLARETYPKLNDTLRKVFLKWCPPDWILKKPTQDDNTVYLKNGSQIAFRYLAQRGRSRDDGTSTSNLLSASYDWIGVDQVEDPGIVHKDFLDLMGRLRGDAPYDTMGGKEDPTMPDTGPRWLMLTANPSHNWFYRELVQPYLLWKETGRKTEKLLVDEDTGVPIVDLFESDTYANKKNLSPDYIKGLEVTFKGQQRERYLHGKWVAFEGLVHPDYESAVHTVSREFAEDHLARCLNRHVKVQTVQGYDFGIASPSCYLIAFVDDLGRVIVVDGFYETEFAYCNQPTRMRELRAKYAGLLSFKDRIEADPGIFRRQVVAGMKETGTTIAKLFEDMGIYMRPATNDITSGIAKVNSYLCGKIGVPHLINGTDNGPLIYFVDDLSWIEDEFSSYYWKTNPLGQRIDEPVDSNDHAMNTIKYLVSHMPEVSKIVVPSDVLPPKWAYWHEMDMDDYRSRMST